jgi:hypothetical protein
MDAPTPQGVPATNGIPIPSGSPMPFMGPVSYPSFYGQYTSPPGAKPGEGTFYQPIYIPVSPHPPQHHATQDGEHHAYPAAHPHYYPPPTFITPYPQHYAPYMMHRADGQFSIPGPHYAAYAPMYARPHPGASSSDMGGIRDTGGDNGGVDKAG